MTPSDGESLASDAKRRSAQGDHEMAVRLQREAVAAFTASYRDELAGRDPDAVRSGGDVTAVARAAHRLADQQGRLGGILRRAGLPDEALASYTDGAELEDAWQLDDSYNRTNRIVLALLTGSETAGEVRPEAHRLAAVVQDQVERTRRNQWWAWADLGLLNLLDGNAATALWAYDHFVGAGARPSDYRSTLSVLRELHAAVAPSAPDLVPAFAAAEDRLEQRHGVFVSYRRDDVAVARGVADALAARLGADHVFFDQDRRAGDRWVYALVRAVQRSAVLVLLVGGEWSRSTGGSAAPGEHARREITAARAAGVRVVPVLLDDAALPDAGTLPPELQFLGSLASLRIRTAEAGSDVPALVDAVVGPM